MIYEKYRNTRIKEPLFLFNIEAEAFFLNISYIGIFNDLHISYIWENSLFLIDESDEGAITIA